MINDETLDCINLCRHAGLFFAIRALIRGAAYLNF